MVKKTAFDEFSKPFQQGVPRERAALFYSGNRGRPSDRASAMSLRVRVEEIRLEHARLVAEEREKDRELERFKIEERRRLRTEAEDRERQRLEDEQQLAETEDGLARVRARIAQSGTALREALDEQETAGGMSEEDRRIADEVKRLFAGTWELPPEPTSR